ncbi:cysteine synthase family protein [Hujiaoplasma nucleasis]|uniref:cysteine synthase n=1 Tax=Hujiaoplasma nucleasis TaxID=2725268 RepID=A0A7L6N0K2_9MOLU|nr:cysteine synthase family protein [Hujiaoplasma nucleasis]QLY39780.1 cysteine synthase family protein [Hujiaoplasma nucleasis]
MSLYDNILETIGNTPLVRLHQFEEAFDLKNQIYAKLESFNPGNNVKTRPAYQMISQLYKSKIMTKDSIIVEATSGNTGIGLAMMGAYFKNKTIIVMPEKVSKERIDLIKHYGGQVILTPAEQGIQGSKNKANELAENPLVVIPSQFENQENPRAHYLHTGKELLDDLPDIDYIFIGVGTGGTISGIGQYFNEHSSKTKIIAIEPSESQVLQGQAAHPHKIAGISPGFIPENYRSAYVDQVVSVSSEEAWKMTKCFVPLEAISIGISSGAALQAAVNYIKKEKIINKNIVVICPDSGEKYFSTGVFE